MHKKMFFNQKNIFFLLNVFFLPVSSWYKGLSLLDLLKARGLLKLKRLKDLSDLIDLVNRYHNKFEPDWFSRFEV